MIHVIILILMCYSCVAAYWFLFCSSGKGIHILYEDVKSCPFEDVHILWSILVESSTLSTQSENWRIVNPRDSNKGSESFVVNYSSTMHLNISNWRFCLATNAEVGTLICVYFLAFGLALFQCCNKTSLRNNPISWFKYKTWNCILDLIDVLCLCLEPYNISFTLWPLLFRP